MLRIIAILILLYIAVRFLGRLLLPPKSGSHHQQRTYGQSNQKDNRKEGEVRIEYTNNEKAKRKRKDSGEGEYVDFEELD